MKYSMIIRGPIGWGTSASQVLECLKENEGKRVDIAVCSLGGFVTDGLEIYQAFRDHGDVHVHIIGTTASAATFLAMGAKSVTMVKSAMFLIHNASTFIFKYDNFNKEKIDTLMKEFQHTRDNLKTFDDVIASLYADKCGKSSEEILAKMKEEKWMTAQQALDFGFIDEIRDDKEAEKLGKEITRDFQNIVNYASNLPALPSTEPEDKENKKFSLRSFIQSFKNNHNKIENSMKHVFKAMCSVLAVDSLESSNDTINISVADVQKIEDRLTELENNNAELEKAKEQLGSELNQTKKTLEDTQNALDTIKKSAGDNPDTVHDSSKEQKTCTDIFHDIKELI